MKRSKKFKQADQRNVQACIDQLQALIDGLRAGGLGFSDHGETVLLTPGGAVDFELRVEQFQRKETLRVQMTWRPEADPSKAPSTDTAAAPPTDGLAASVASSELPAPSNGAHFESEAPGAPALDQWATAEYQRWFAAAHVLDSGGQWYLDQDRLMLSLESAGVDPLTQQELYALALQADADGRGSLLSARVLDAIRRVSRPRLSPLAEPAPHNGSP